MIMTHNNDESEGDEINDNEWKLSDDPGCCDSGGGDDNEETVDDESDYNENNEHDEAQNDNDYKPATMKMTNFNVVRSCW